MKTLTIPELRKIVPAAFAESPAKRVSERYSFIPTTRVIDEVMASGWLPTRAYQSRVVADQLHATHMITFRHPNLKVKLDGVLPEVTVFNNHMALKCYKMLAGFFRMICSNGLVVSAGIGESRVTKIHKDGAEVDVFITLNAALSKLDSAVADIIRWQATQLTFLQQQDFAARAILMKNNNDPVWSKHFDAHEFLNRRREEDRGNDLWTVYNVVQENIMKGGVQGASRLTRAITQVAEVQRINEGLWQLADEFGKLHSVS